MTSKPGTPHQERVPDTNRDGAGRRGRRLPAAVGVVQGRTRHHRRAEQARCAKLGSRLTAAVLCWAVVPAAAQTGTRIPGAAGVPLSQYGQPDGPPVVQSKPASLFTARVVAACTVRRFAAPVGAYLQAQEAGAQQQASRRLDTPLSECIDSTNTISRFEATSMSMDRSTLSGLLAEAWLRANAAVPLEPVAAAKREYAAAWVSADPNKRVVDEMASCLAEMKPQQSLALVRSDPDTRAERSAFNALVPAIGPCLAKGATLKTNITGARLSIANALYHRQYDAPAPAAGGTPRSTN